MITTPLGPEFVKNDDQSGAKSGDHTQAALSPGPKATSGPISTKMLCLPTARPTTGGPFGRPGPFDHCV